jgi:hypothetical protein
VPASSSAVGLGPSRDSTSQVSVLPGDIATSSASSRVAGRQRASRATTASRTVSGTTSPRLASTSRTKNGLPPVT